MGVKTLDPLVQELLRAAAHVLSVWPVEYEHAVCSAIAYTLQIERICSDARAVPMPRYYPNDRKRLERADLCINLQGIPHIVVESKRWQDTDSTFINKIRKDAAKIRDFPAKLRLLLVWSAVLEDPKEHYFKEHIQNETDFFGSHCNFREIPSKVDGLRLFAQCRVPTERGAVGIGLFEVQQP
jgi:hypothetical protein